MLAVFLLLASALFAEEGLTPVELDRLATFDHTQRFGKHKDVYADVKQSGKTIRLLVKDTWDNLDKTDKEVFVTNSFGLFIKLGRERGIDEKPGDYNIEVLHSDMNKLLATWDALGGFKLKE
jgi:hypothetical protein